MATFIVGLVLAAALFLALRHVFNNFREGKEDCCGSGCAGCSGSCHAAMQKK